MTLRIARRLALVAVLLACTPLAGAGQPEAQVSFRLADREPSGRATLSGGQPLYLRIDYESNVGIRFRAKAYSAGELVERTAAYNPAPAYPPGKGEGLAWISLSEAVRIDEIRVTALDDRWRELATQSFSVDVSWNDVPVRRPREPAGWARRLSDEQQQMSRAVQAGDEGPDILSGLLVSLMGLSIPAYLLIQAGMLLQFRNGWRKAAMAPLLGMIPLVLYTLLALLAGSNVWPLALLFLTPIALAYLVVVGILKWLTAGRGAPLGRPNPSER